MLPVHVTSAQSGDVRWASMSTGLPGRLAAVVLNFRTPDETVTAVRSLLSSTRPPDDLIVVDNDAGPGCRVQVAGLHPAVRYSLSGE